jgi:hypothetical protein
MVSKTIKKIFNQKINDWLKYVDDEEIKKIIKENIIITGGAIVNLLLNEKVKDFDVYFRNKDSVLKVAQYYVKKFNDRNGAHQNKIGHLHKAFVLDGALNLEEQLKSTDNPVLGVNDDGTEKRDWNSHMIHNLTLDRIKIIVRSDGVAGENQEPFEDVYDTDIVGEDSVQNIYQNAVENADEVKEDEAEKEEKGRYFPVFLSANAITLSNKIQIVVRFYGEPEEIHKNYGFIHCTCYWTSWNNELALPAKALEAIINKQLVYQGSKYPICSLMRMRKFIYRGFTINAGQILKICYAISNLDLTDIAVLEDQLVGVDSAYFMQLIEALQRKQLNDPEFVINEGYVCTILDKLFG